MLILWEEPYLLMKVRGPLMEASVKDGIGKVDSIENRMGKIEHEMESWLIKWLFGHLCYVTY